MAPPPDSSRTAEMLRYPGTMARLWSEVWSVLTSPRSTLPRLEGRYMVVGSGPGSRPPPDGWTGWQLAAVNGSAVLAERMGAPEPDIILLGPLVLGRKEANLGAQANLRGRQTRLLISVGGRRRYAAVADAASQLALGYDRLIMLRRDQRRRFIRDYASGERVFLRGKIPSSGILLALVCLAGGAEAVVMSGFSLTQTGHAYDTKNLGRAHVNKDRMILAEIARRGFPLFTNDPVFAGESGLPLWPDA